MNKSERIIYFATTSEVKFRQYEIIFNDLGFKLLRAPAINNLIEPQLDESSSSGYELLVSHPLRMAARFISKSGTIPYLIEDTSLIIDVLSNSKDLKFGLPGADTKNWWNNLGVEGVLDILRNKQNRKARYISVVGVYLGNNNYLFEQSVLEGTISESNRKSEIAEKQVPLTNPFFFHSIFIPEGHNKTLAEMDRKEFPPIDYRRDVARKIAVSLVEFQFQQSSQLKLPF